MAVLSNTPEAINFNSSCGSVIVFGVVAEFVHAGHLAKGVAAQDHFLSRRVGGHEEGVVFKFDEELFLPLIGGIGKGNPTTLFLAHFVDAARHLDAHGVGLAHVRSELGKGDGAFGFDLLAKGEELAGSGIRDRFGSRAGPIGGLGGTGIGRITGCDTEGEPEQ